MYRVVLAFLIVIGLSACSVHRSVVSTGDKRVARIFDSSDLLGKHDTGFMLYDPASGAVLYEKASNRYFTPGSNVKILTLVAVKEILTTGYVTAVRYTMSGDTLMFQGYADPSLLYRGDSVSYRAIDELFSQHSGTIQLISGPDVRRYGPGWAWDDYDHSFQPERSAMPVFGNAVHLRMNAVEMVFRPSFYKAYLTQNYTIDRPIEREEAANVFYYNPYLVEPGESYSAPFIPSGYDLARILSDEFGRDIGLKYTSGGIVPSLAPVQGPSVDTLLRDMMRDSDNFIAEELLLQAAFEQGLLSTGSVIEECRNTLFSGSPDALKWYDGSGLSRYNLLTPRSIVYVLDKIHDDYGVDFIREVFPAGGESGTLTDAFESGKEEPIIYAKSGSLKNNYNLSGVLICRSGRILLFSFMNNRFVGGTQELKDEMAKILKEIHLKY